MPDPAPESPDQHHVWNTIGAGFSQTRPRPWGFVEDRLATWGAGRGRRLLDLMGGNGRHASAAQERGWGTVTVDWSRTLLADAPGRVGPVCADATCLPLHDASVDAVLYIAGLHGIPDPAGRQASLQEAYRVARPGARLLLSVWSRDAPRFQDLDGQDGGDLDVVVPWRRDGLDLDRTVHLYTQDSLRAAVEEAGWVVDGIEAIAVSAPTPDNLVVAAHKTR